MKRLDSPVGLHYGRGVVRWWWFGSVLLGGALVGAVSGGATHGMAAAEPAGAPAEASDRLFDEDFDDFDVGPAPPDDPFEGMNRTTHRVNEEIDRWVLDPITWTYRKVTPDVFRRSVRNFFWNLSEPTTMVNDVLQREWDDAAVSLTRMVVNSTLGVGGLFDPASSLGMEPHESDFGQTMALAGVASGPYVVLPVVGPSTVRDGVGMAVDVVFRPSTFVVPLADQLVFTTIQGGGFGLTLREEYYDQLRILKESSIDYYSALRSAYAQNREAEIWDRRMHHLDADDGLPEEAGVIPTSPMPTAQTSTPPPEPESRSRHVAAPSRTRIASARSH